MKCVCGGETEVVNTRTVDGYKRRQRKCVLCAQSFYTKEVRISGIDIEPVTTKPKPKPDKRGVYTKETAAEVKQQKVDARRNLEDLQEKRRMRVSNYFIEDEDW
jgi:predicted RNA-binding protein YlxR (DUF448 family)